jgi:hypothetical protein
VRTLLPAVLLSSCAAVLLSSRAAAQGPTDPPPLIQLVRKPGTGAMKIRRYAAARAAVDVIGLNAVTGLPESWLLESHQSFASIEDLDRSLSAVAAPVRASSDPSDPLQDHVQDDVQVGVQDDVLAPARTMVAVMCRTPSPKAMPNSGTGKSRDPVRGAARRIGAISSRGRSR